MRYRTRSLMFVVAVASIIALIAADRIAKQRRIEFAVRTIRHADVEHLKDPTAIAVCIQTLRRLNLADVIEGLRQLDHEPILRVIMPLLFDQNDDIPSIPVHEYVVCDGLVFKRWSPTTFSGISLKTIDVDNLRLNKSVLTPSNDLRAACEEAINRFETYAATKGYNKDDLLDDLIYWQAFEATKHLFPNEIDEFTAKLQSNSIKLSWDSAKLKYKLLDD